MGLGKSAQAIALDLERRKNNETWANGKTLIVTPLAVIESWKRQFKLWAPHLNVIAVNPRKRDDFIDSVYLGDNHIYLVHWQGLRLMPELCERKWLHVVGDEIHYIQNRKAQVSKAFKEIPTLFKTGLSGTPAYDKPDDLWSILNWLYPTFWRSYWAYFDQHVLWVDYNGYKQVIGVANEEELQEQMRGFYIRRKKEEVLHDLPERYYSQIFVDLTPKQRRAYNQMRDNMLAWVGKNEDKPVNATAVVSQLTRLQQFASAHAEVTQVEKWRKFSEEEFAKLIESNNRLKVTLPSQAIADDAIDHENRKVKVKVNEVRLADPSSKIDAALEIVLSTNKQIVFFSQFSQVIDLFCSRLDKHGISCGKYTGTTSNQDRTKIVEQFKLGKLRIFAGTVGAGGTGLDGLQVADTVVFFDRPWSHSTFEQAVARLHRIGQKNAVQVIDLIASGTLEKKRIENIELTWSWIKQLIGEDD